MVVVVVAAVVGVQFSVKCVLSTITLPSLVTIDTILSIKPQTMAIMVR